MTTKKNAKRMIAKSPRLSYLFDVIRPRLESLVGEMESIGEYMDFNGGFGEMGKHGRELLGAAKIARQWLRKMKKK